MSKKHGIKEGSGSEQPKKNAPRTRVGKSSRGRKAEREEGAAFSQRPLCEKCGQEHRRCAGHTKHGPNAGKPCGANPRTGQSLCIKHGGNHPAHKKKGKERLLELVDPALATLFRILTDEKVDDAVKVRAAVAVLDRAGLRPGVVVEVEPGDKWSELLDGATFRDNRALGGGGERELTEHAALQLALDARDEAWREYDAEDAEPYNGPSRIDPDENTIRGSVVQSRYVGRPAPGPTDPPLYWPEDVRRGDA